MEYIAINKNQKVYIKEKGANEYIKAPFNSILKKLLTSKDDKTVIYFKNLRCIGEKFYPLLKKQDYKKITRKSEKKENTYYIKQNQAGVIYEISIFINKKFCIVFKNIDTSLFTKKNKTTQEELHELEEIVLKLKNVGCKNSSLPSFGFIDWTKTLARHFRCYFPPIQEEIDNEIRQAYNHGVYYFNRRYLYKKITHGVSLDINSMYPYILISQPLPMGEPMPFNGAYAEDILHPLYIQEVYCTISPKRKGINYLDKEKTDGLPIKHLWISNIELETLKKHYNIEIIQQVKGYKFKSCKYLFDKFVKKWYRIKVYCGVGEDVSRKCFTEKYGVPDDMVTPDPIMAKFSKIVLNTLIGQFGRKPYTISRTTHLKNGHIKYTEERKKAWSIYLPLAIFVVDYGRQMILDMAQQVKDYSLKKYGEDRYIYTDTDCIRTTLPLKDLQGLFEISPTELGKFKIEEEWDSAYFCGIKSYVTKQKGKINFHVAGLETHEHKNWLQENNIKL